MEFKKKSNNSKIMLFILICAVITTAIVLIKYNYTLRITYKDTHVKDKTEDLYVPDRDKKEEKLPIYTGKHTIVITCDDYEYKFIEYRKDENYSEKPKSIIDLLDWYNNDKSNKYTYFELGDKGVTINRRTLIRIKYFYSVIKE